MGPLLDQEGWIPCLVAAADAVIELDDYLKTLSPEEEIRLPATGC